MDRLTKWIEDYGWTENHDNDTREWKNGSRACMGKLAAYEDTSLTPEEVADLAKAKEQGRLVVLPDDDAAPTPDELECFVRCEDCIYGGWTDDVQTHCNKWVLRDSDHRCVGYLNYCGAGEKGKMLELEEAEAALAGKEGPE